MAVWDIDVGLEQLHVSPAYTLPAPWQEQWEEGSNKEEGFVLARSAGFWVIIAEESRWQELKAAAHIESAVTEQGVMNMSW